MPIQYDLSEDVKRDILNKRERVLSKVKGSIDNNLNLKKRNIFNSYKENLVEVPPIKEILEKPDISEEEYYSTLEVSSDLDFQIHIQRKPNSCFVNNYFVEGLLAWKGNIDFQPVF